MLGMKYNVKVKCKDHCTKMTIEVQLVYIPTPFHCYAIVFFFCSHAKLSSLSILQFILKT